SVRGDSEGVFRVGFPLGPGGRLHPQTPCPGRPGREEPGPLPAGGPRDFGQFRWREKPHPATRATEFPGRAHLRRPVSGAEGVARRDFGTGACPLPTKGRPLMSLLLTSTREHALLAMLIQEASNVMRAAGGYLGRTAIQKMMYFLHVRGVPM